MTPHEKTNAGRDPTPQANGRKNRPLACPDNSLALNNKPAQTAIPT